MMQLNHEITYIKWDPINLYSYIARNDGRFLFLWNENPEVMQISTGNIYNTGQ